LSRGGKISDADGAGYGGLYDPLSADPYRTRLFCCFCLPIVLLPDQGESGLPISPAMDLDGVFCQVSGWDHVFLGLFWMFNTIAIAVYHFSWKMQSDM